MAQALNARHQGLILLIDEISQVKKVVVQNHKALDLLTTVQGCPCALLHTECCIHIPDHQTQIKEAL